MTQPQDAAGLIEAAANQAQATIDMLGNLLNDGAFRQAIATRQLHQRLTWTSSALAGAAAQLRSLAAALAKR